MMFRAARNLKYLSVITQYLGLYMRRGNWNYWIKYPWRIERVNALSSVLMLQVCQSATSDCRTKVMDLVFMLPSSSSVGSNGWSDIIDFVNTIVGALEIDSGLARVGLLKLVLLVISLLLVYFA